MAIRCRYDHHSFLRAYQSYRNLSRHCKQYFYGDKQLEEAFILGLRSFFMIPMVSETPTDQIKHGAERRFVDQLDRDFELVSYNQHPFQLFTYELNNKHVAREQEKYEQQQNGEQTFEQQMVQYLDNVIAAEKAKLREGQQLSSEKLTEIILQAFRKARAEEKRPQQNSRGDDGQITDFLEQRRPFGAPTNVSHTH
ncbi:hypothetical protein PPERSA_02743 [Pseudocohnilembus persalinus]|uniref:Uncharacterized protein n=1 Tax=Pseudocohnilembus persalinus TaxID=266149 RepID=A0A0V0R739_PSEPJ|nr:hypothetical protein PPERSA_02743 [Pseudocohnilembus persalinus]|eukprot:KRX10326.1 hypothetical protein PPERSA_02743 [Pseudocohnilembus persalinus]